MDQGRTVHRAVCTLVLLAGLGVEARAQPADDAVAFAKPLVTAINTRNAERRTQLAHPASLLCLNGRARLFFEDTSANQGTPPIPSNYRAQVKAIPASQPLLFADRFDYAVRPTHQLQIDFETGQFSGKTLVVQIAHDGRQWREVWPCPKPETLAQMVAAKEARIEHDKKVQALAAGMAAPLRAQILALAQQGQKVEAIRRYQSVSGEDLAVAKDVVERLLAQPR